MIIRHTKKLSPVLKLSIDVPTITPVVCMAAKGADMDSVQSHSAANQVLPVCRTAAGPEAGFFVYRPGLRVLNLPLVANVGDCFESLSRGRKGTISKVACCPLVAERKNGKGTLATPR